MQTIKDRFAEFLTYKGFGQAKFAELAGLSRGFLSTLTGNMTQKTKDKISAAFPELNLDWLLTGQGEMIKTEIMSDVRPTGDLQFLNIPFVPIPAQAGYGKGYGDLEYIKTLPTFPVIVDKNYRGKYRVFEVDGDSMDDGSRQALYDGDKILCREVKPELWKSKLHIKDWFFVICMKNDGITVKQITEHNVEGCTIKCHPLNPIFEDFVVDLKDVAELYNVIKIVDRNARI